MKTKKRTLHVLPLIFTLILVACLGITTGQLPVLAQETNPVAEKVSEANDGLYQEYTDNVDKKRDIVKYEEEEYASNVSFSVDDPANINKNPKFPYIIPSTDDPIVNFVPKELFGKINTTLHVGRHYGFYIETVKVDFFSALSPTYDPDGFQSIVMLFTVDVSNDLIESKSHLKYRITPIFQGEFAYGEPDDRYFIEYALTQGYRGDRYELHFPEGMDSVVFPIPTHGFFTQSHRIYLTDFVLSTSLYNKNHLNAGDPGYDVTKDYGSFFSQYDFAYRGKFFQSGNTDSEEVGSLVLDTVLFGAGVFVPGGTAFKTALDAYGLVSSLVDLVIQASGLADNCAAKMVSEEKLLTYEPQYNSREMQIENNGYLYRDMYTIISTPEDQRRMLLGTDDFIELDYQINTPDISYDTYFGYALTCTALDMDKETETRNIGVFLDEIKTRQGSQEELIDLGTREDALTVQDNVSIFPGEKMQRNLPILREGTYDFFCALPYANFRIETVGNGAEVVAESSSDNSGAWIRDVSLKRSETYRMFFMFDRNADGKNRYGVLPLETRFKPTPLQFDTNIIQIGAGNEAFAIFTPQTSDVYTFDFENTSPDLMITIRNELDHSMRDIFFSENVHEVFLTKDVPYLITFVNNDYDNEKTCTFGFSACPTIEPDETLHFEDADGRIFSFTPAYSGDYTLSLTKDPNDILASFDVSLYNEAFEKIYNSNSLPDLEFRRTLKEGQKYFYRINASSSIGLDATLSFTPQETDGKSVWLFEIADYEIIRFTPKLSGSFQLTFQNANGATAAIYDPEGTDVTAQSLQFGETYYIKVQATEHIAHGKLLISLESDTLSNGQPYDGYTVGSNTVSFVAPVTGIYEIEGLTQYTVLDDGLASVFDQNSGFIQLAEGLTYYIRFDAAHADPEILIRFAPPALDMTTSTVFNNPSFYELNYPSGNYIFRAKSLLSKDARLSLYDGSLNLLVSEFSSVQYDLVEGETYYLYAEIYGIDTLLSVSSDVILGSDTVAQYTEGVPVNFALAAFEKKTFRFDYNKTLSATRYYFKINEVLGEQIQIYIETLDADQNLQRISLIGTGAAGLYYCDLEKAYDSYYISLNTRNAKQVQFDFFVPTRIEQILFNDRDIKTYLDNPRMGIGSLYRYNIVTNSDATYPATLNTTLNTDLVNYASNFFTITNDSSKKGYTVELKFETKYMTDFKMYSFILDYAYTAVGTIYNNVFSVSYFDLYGAPALSIYPDVTFQYQTTEGTKANLTASEYGKVDLTMLPEYRDVEIYANVNFGNRTQIVTVLFNQERFSIATAVNFTGRKRVVFDASHDTATLNQTLQIPSNVQFVYFKGNASLTYQSLTIKVLSRTTKLTLYLDSFSFTSTTDSAISAPTDSTLDLYVRGHISLTSSSSSTAGVNVGNLNIFGQSKTASSLSVTGGNRAGNETISFTAGNGLICQAINIHNIKLSAAGGYGTYSGGNGYYGAHGGMGLQAAIIYLYTAELTATGGDGGVGNTGATGDRGYDGSENLVNDITGSSGKAGHSGKNGGNGGNGGVGISCIMLVADASSSATVRGGNGGFGGAGGRGGNGGNGKNGAATGTWGSPEGGGNGGDGGNGGNGGDAGNGGAAIVTNYYSESVSISEGIAGRGGNGGRGGDGGNGARTGTNYFKSTNTRNGGNGGKGGNSGNGSPRGNPGAGGWGGSKGVPGGASGTGTAFDNGVNGTAGASGDY